MPFCFLVLKQSSSWESTAASMHLNQLLLPFIIKFYYGKFETHKSKAANTIRNPHVPITNLQYMISDTLKYTSVEIAAGKWRWDFCTMTVFGVHLCIPTAKAHTPASMEGFIIAFEFGESVPLP